MAIDNRRKLYDALSQDYDMGSYEQFCTDLNDEAKRRKLYDATIQEYDFGSWDSFSQQLGYSLANTLEPQLLHPSVSTIDDGPVANASTTTAHVPQGYHDEDGIFHPYPISDTATDTATSPVPQNTTGNEVENGWQPSPMQKAAMIAEIQSGVDKTIGNMRNSVENVRRLVESNSTEGRNKRKAAEMQARMVGTPTKVPGLTAGIKSSTTKDAPNEPGNPNSPIPYGVKMENGEAKTEWLLPDGTLSTSLIDADKAEFGAREARLQHEFVKRMEENGLDPAKKSDIEEQRKKDLLDVAEIQTESRLAENEEHLHKLYDKRAGELDQQREWDDDEGFWSNFVRIVGGAANRNTTINAPKQQSSTIEDKEIGTYMAENQILTDARKLLETRKLNKSYGFMGGFWNIGNNWRNMKMGAKHTLSDSDYYLNGVMALQKASRLMEIEDKLKQGAELTDAEVSLVYSTALGQAVQNNTDTPHGYTVAQIELEMFPFMAQMALNPASGLSRAMVTKFGKSGLRKIAMKKAAQGLTEEAAAQFAKRETRKLAAKAVGVQVAGDVAESAVLANTLQGAKTAADAMERYQGNVVINDNGIITFDGNHNWAEAIYKAEASATIENYTEMLGEHFGIIGNALGKGAGKGLRAIGGGKIVDTVSDMIAKIGTNEWGKAISAVEKRAHWNGTVGEVLEEEAGIVLNSIFTGDNKISDLWDADQQIDIVLGVGLFGGFMSGLKTVGYPIGKSKAKGNLRKSDSIGAWRFGDGWTYIRDEINNAEEKDLGNVVRDLVRGHAKSDEQGKAIVEYAHALMNSRGYEIASASARSEGTSSPEQQDIEESFEHGEHLAETEVPQEMGDAKRMLDLQRQRLASALSEDVVHDFDTDPIGALSRTHDPETRSIAADYVNAKAAYDGMIQRVRDDIDGRIAQSDAMIDGHVNRTTGMIQPATMRSDGKETQVYVVDGELAMFEDGSGIDTQNSSESIIIRDAETGKIEFADPTRFVSVDNGIDAETEKEAVRQQIRQEVAQAAANKIDGVLSFTPGDTYNVLDMDGQPQVVSIVGQPVDENGVPVEGQVNIQYPDGQIQQVAMSDLQQQVDAANAQRVENFVSENAETVPNIAENAEISTENGENITENVPKTVERAENIQEYDPSLYDENTIQPVGQGRFGYIYNQFKGKAMAAFHFLLNLKNGEAKGVFHRDDLGDIDVIWGTEKGGLYHIIKKHIIEQADFNSVEDAVERISDVVEHGEPIVHGDETLIIKDGYKAVLARNDDGRFVLTAYDNNRSVAEKKRTAEEATLFHQSLLGGRMVNHVSPVSDSLGKVNATDGDLQESPISESTVKPVGTGMFGNIFNAFKQKAKEAAAFLYKLKGGEALDVFTRDEIGGISLVWGDDTKGLQHIIRKHIVEHSDFESVSEMVESLNGVITNGDIIIQKGGNYRIEKDGYRAIIAKSEDGGFVLTAYDKTRTQDDKRRSDADAALFDQRVSEEMNGTLVSSGTAPVSKDNVTEGDLQASALSRIPMDDNGGYRFDAVDPETAWDGMVEFMENEDDASEYAAAMVGESDAAVKKAEQAITKIKPANDPAKFKAAKAAARSALSEAQRQVAHWQNVAKVASSRRAAIEEAARQQAEAERAAQIAAETRREAERQAKARRKAEEDAAAPREYAKAYAGWEQPATFEEYVLRRLSAGGMKLKWGKNERTGTNGLGAMLGYGSGTREQQGLLWLLDNANGYYPEEAAERMLVDFKAETGMEPNMDAMDAHNTLLDVIATHGTSRAMWTEAKRRHDAMEATAPIDEEYERQREWYETHFGMSPEEYEAYEEQVYSDIAAHEISDDEMSDFIATFADAILTEQKEREEYERNREHDNSAAGSLRERGDGILPEERPDIAAGDNPLVKRAQEADGNGNRPDGGSPQESQLSDVSENEAEEDVLCRPVTDKATLDRLNSEPTIKVYRAMQMIDGGLRPPMSGKVDGQWREATEVGVWEEAEEHPEMADKKGRFKLDKGNGKSIKAAYNPYIHTSRTPINDQFSSAWSRPELVIAEVEVPASELTSGYHAEKAKDSVGEKEWKSGPVGRALAKIGQARRVILSRWSRVVRVVPVEEVAEAYAQRLNAHGIEVPFNTVPPALRDALAKRGVKIGKPEKGNAGKASMPAFEQWIAEQERLRMGEGAYTDEELSMANDPWSKAWGESLRTKRQQKEFASRERKRMAERVKELTERLHLDNVEVVTDTSTLSGKRATAKGFFNNRTGKITIVLPNNSSATDIEQTLLHEAVAHYGLRQLLGNHFDEFLDKVYEAADEVIKAQIDVLAIRNGWNRRVATEEYMAGLAEDADFDKAQERIGGWFSKIKHFFIDMLRKVGFKNISPYSLRDNELRYILWRSYQNLANPSRYRAFEWEAEDVAMQYELSVGEYAPHDAITESRVAEAGELDEINERFNEQLQRWEMGKMRPEEIVNAGYPMGIMRLFMPKLPLLLRQKVLSKSRKKHGLTAKEMSNLPGALANPIFVFKSNPKTVSVLTELKSDKGENLFVAVELGKDLDFGGNAMVVNDILTVHGREVENIVLPIKENNTLIWVDKKKGLKWLHSAKSNSQAITTQTLDDAAKIIEKFENPTINGHNNNVEDDGDVRFRDGDFTPRDRKLAATQYERMLSRGSWQFKEAVQDSMLGLKTLYESILGKGTRIEDVAGYENAYLYENRMSSTNNGEQHQYFIQYMKPLLDSIYDLCGNDKLERRILTDYMMAKHGLERNEKMRVEAAAKKEDTDRDFAGLCGLTGEDSWISAEAEAQKMVDEYERNHDTTELWENVRKATNATLEKIYLSGLMSDETFNKVQGMYDFYIPLRGWDETTSNEVYGYLTSNDGPLTGNVFKKATGRKSKADDPIATIAMMADDAIRQGNRNIMKQRFLNFVHGNPSDLVSINDMWLQHDDVTDEWKPVFAKLKPDMTREEVESEVAKFEAKMERLKKSEPDKYARGNDACNIPYKVINSDLREHQVLVKRNGRTYVMTINGNPRAAQALNGLTNPDVEVGGVVGNLLKGAEYVNRNLSAFYTTRNPDFVVSNFMRDTLYSNCMAWVKESRSYALRFHKNFGKVNPVILGHLLHKWENGTLDDSNKLERMFKEFMLNGGETGYTSVKDIEGHKRTIASELKKHGNIGRKAWSALGMQLDLLNRSAENCARFAAFLTSREMGRTLDRSIYDAKEVSVNFNKKGSGGKFVNATGQTTLGKIGASISGSGRILYVFWNAGVQGMTNFGRAAKRHPGKALGGAAALFTLGYVIPLLAQICGSGDGDDDKNAYYNLPEHIRRSNICFHVGDQWITIPLPIEYRAIYGMGELACGVISGNERYSNSELAYHMAAQVSQAMPLDILEGDGGFSAFIPSAVKPVTEAYVMNKSWSGLPIYKDTPFNKNDPEWTKAYQSADQHLVAFTKWLNETSGGDDYKKGAIDINPAKIEYLLSGTFGGVFTTFENLKKTGETIIGKREFEWRNTPIANRVVKSGDERTANRKLQNEYFKYFEEYNETKRLYGKYDNAAANGILGYAEKANFLYNSPEYLRLEKFEQYKPEMDAFRAQLKEETDPKKKKEIQAEMFGIMRELVDSLRVVGQ